MKVLISDVIIGERARATLGDIESLAGSIEEIGLLQPICIDENKMLVDGQRRIEACKLLGWKEIEANQVNIKSLLIGEYDANMLRKDFTPSEAVALADKIRKNDELLKSLRDKSGQIAHQKKTRELVADAIGIGDRTLRKAEKVVELARNDPETFGSIRDEMDVTGKVNPAYLQSMAIQSNIKSKEKIVPVVYMPDGKKKELSHLVSDKFKSGSVLRWIADELNLIPDDDLIMITRKGNKVYLWQKSVNETEFNKGFCYSIIVKMVMTHKYRNGDYGDPE